MRKVVVNSTPLMALCHVGQLDILKAMYVCVYIPGAVYGKLSAKPESICKTEKNQILTFSNITTNNPMKIHM